MMAAMEYTETKVGNACNKCWSQSVTGKHKGANTCDGVFGPGLKKTAGGPG